jgi:hypothetical protein
MKNPRHGVRNHAMILLAHRHDLRASEVTDMLPDLNLCLAHLQRVVATL